MASDDYLSDLIKKVKASKTRAKKSQAASSTPKPLKPPRHALKEKPVHKAEPRAPKGVVDEPSTAAGPKIFPKRGEDSLGLVKHFEKMRMEEEKESGFEKEMEEAEKSVVASYGETKIYKVKGQEMLYYNTPVPRPTGAEKAIIDTIKEAATRLITIAPYKVRDREQRKSVYYQQVMDILKTSPELKIPAHRYEFYANSVVREMVGYGLIDPLINDDKLEEIMVIGPKIPVYVFHREFEMMVSNIEFFSDKDVQDLANKIAREVGRRIDVANPLLDARLADGSRVNATIPPASVQGSTITIRKFKKDPYTLVDLTNNSTISLDSAAFLWLTVEGMGTMPANTLISGGTGSGKTTFLNILCSMIPGYERILTIEDTAELSLPITHWVRMEARPPGLEGKGELTLDILTKNALRMRPDRVIVGEVRHAEAFSLFTAMNTGHQGCLTGDAKLAFVDGIQEIGEFVDSEISKENYWKENEWEVFRVRGKQINCLNDEGKIVKEEVVEARRKPFEGKVRHIKTASGYEIVVTPNHPFYNLGGNIEQIAAEDLEEGEFIATPRLLHRSQTANDAETEYWSGLLHGDWHVLDKKRVREKNNKKYICNEGRISLYTEEETIVPEFIKFMKENFDDTYAKTVYPRPNKMCYEVHVSGATKAKKAIQLFNIPAGSRYEGKLSNTHYQNSLNAFVAGFFDAEGHVSLQNNMLMLANANEYYIDFLKYALLTEGIVARKYESKTHNSRYYTLYVYGIDQVKRFAEVYPLKYPAKIKRLEKIISSSKQTNTNVDLVPCNKLIKKKIIEARKIGVSERQIARKAGISQGLLRFIRIGLRKPSLDTVKKLAKAFESCGVVAKEIGQLARADVFWDRIVAIHEFDYNGFVYDLTVSEPVASGKKPHNFVANGIIVGNSMGTLHANSSKETVVRVTSPPMTVPELMLSALDLIIVLQRIHDRKKGTIRRVIEISEITGVLEGKTQIQAIFERDPATDTLKRTSVPSKYLAKVCRFTGMTKQQLEANLKKREKYLKKLVNANVSKMEEFSAAIKDYMLGEKENA